MSEITNSNVKSIQDSKPITNSDVNIPVNSVSHGEAITSNPVKKYVGKGSNPNSKKNLVSLADRTLEERKAIGRKGGLKSGEKRQERRTMKDTILEMLSETISDELIQEYGLDKVLKGKEKGKSFQDAIIGATLIGAMNGDVRAISLLRDTIGEMPTIRQDITSEIITKEDGELMDNLRKSLIS